MFRSVLHCTIGNVFISSFICRDQTLRFTVGSWIINKSYSTWTLNRYLLTAKYWNLHGMAIKNLVTDHVRRTQGRHTACRLMKSLAVGCWGTLVLSCTGKLLLWSQYKMGPSDAGPGKNEIAQWKWWSQPWPIPETPRKWPLWKESTSLENKKWKFQSCRTVVWFWQVYGGGLHAIVKG